MSRRAFLLGRNTEKLRHCDNDVQLMVQALRRHRFTITVAPADASPGAVSDLLAEVVQECSSKDTLVVYFSGHSFGDDGLRLVLGAPVHDLRNQLAASVLVDLLRRCEARSKLLILDSCQSGQAARNAWPDQPGEHFRLLTATDGVSLAKEHDDLDAGVFTHHLHRALTEEGLWTWPDGVVSKDGHLSVNSLYPWLRDAVTGFARVEGKPLRSAPQLFGGSADQDVFFAENLVRPPTPADPQPAAGSATRPQGWDGPAADHWLLKTLDRADVLAKLQDLLCQSKTPQLAVIDALHSDRPDYLADCAMLWPEKYRSPIRAIDEDAPPAFAFDLSLETADVDGIWSALHVTLPSQAQDDGRKRQAVCNELRCHRHVVLRCTLELRRPSRRPLRFIRIACRFLDELGAHEPGLAVLLLVVCEPPAIRFPWWWSLWHLSARRVLAREPVHWIDRLGPLSGAEVDKWYSRLPDDMRRHRLVGFLHDRQRVLLTKTGHLSYEELRQGLRRALDQLINV